MSVTTSYARPRCDTGKAGQILFPGRDARDRIQLVDAVVAADVHAPQLLGPRVVGAVGGEVRDPSGIVDRVAGLRAVGQIAVVEVVSGKRSAVRDPEVAGVGVERDAPAVGEVGRIVRDDVAARERWRPRSPERSQASRRPAVAQRGRRGAGAQRRGAIRIARRGPRSPSRATGGASSSAMSKPAARAPVFCMSRIRVSMPPGSTRTMSGWGIAWSRPASRMKSTRCVAFGTTVRFLDALP